MTTALMPRNRDLILAGPVGSLDAYIAGVNAIPVLDILWDVVGVEAPAEAQGWVGQLAIANIPYLHCCRGD